MAIPNLLRLQVHTRNAIIDVPSLPQNWSKVWPSPDLAGMAFKSSDVPQLSYIPYKKMAGQLTRISNVNVLWAYRWKTFGEHQKRLNSI
jgi:hypothetical protein